MKYLSQEFDRDIFDLVKQKGFYPYEYIRSFEKFKEHLHSTEKFNSLLTLKKFNDKKYQHPLKAWYRFQMKTIKNYHSLYLKCDVSFLAGVFEKFIKNILWNYGLCPSHYLSAPALSWSAMLNMTEIELGIISDADIYLIFEKCVRGESFLKF